MPRMPNYWKVYNDGDRLEYFNSGYTVLDNGIWWSQWQFILFTCTLNRLELHRNEIFYLQIDISCILEVDKGQLM